MLEEPRLLYLKPDYHHSGPNREFAWLDRGFEARLPGVNLGLLIYGKVPGILNRMLSPRWANNLQVKGPRTTSTAKIVNLTDLYVQKGLCRLGPLCMLVPEGREKRRECRRIATHTSIEQASKPAIIKQARRAGDVLVRR